MNWIRKAQRFFCYGKGISFLQVYTQVNKKEPIDKTVREHYIELLVGNPGTSYLVRAVCLVVSPFANTALGVERIVPV